MVRYRESRFRSGDKAKIANWRERESEREGVSTMRESPSPAFARELFLANSRP